MPSLETNTQSLLKSFPYSLTVCKIYLGEKKKEKKKEISQKDSRPTIHLSPVSILLKNRMCTVPEKVWGFKYFLEDSPNENKYQNKNAFYV